MIILLNSGSFKRVSMIRFSVDNFSTKKSFYMLFYFFFYDCYLSLLKAYCIINLQTNLYYIFNILLCFIKAYGCFTHYIIDCNLYRIKFLSQYKISLKHIINCFKERMVGGLIFHYSLTF